MCGAKRLGHFGRNEFYIALKLISAAQNGYMPMLDICNSGEQCLISLIIVSYILVYILWAIKCGTLYLTITVTNLD